MRLLKKTSWKTLVWLVSVIFLITSVSAHGASPAENETAQRPSRASSYKPSRSSSKPRRSVTSRNVKTRQSRVSATRGSVKGRHGYRGHGRYRHSSVRVYYPIGLGYYGFSFPYYGYGYPYYRWGYGYGHGYYGYGPYGSNHPRYNPNAGAIDLNIKPKKAKVYLNGQFIGKAGKYDGFPDFLWLEEGDYELIYYLPGHKTERREYSVHSGVVLREHLGLEAGEPTPPEELSQKSFAVKRDSGDSSIADHPIAKRRYQPKRKARTNEELDLRGDPGRLSLAILPADASVYLDGHFLGTASELSNREGDLIVNAGEHRLEVVRPGFESKELDFFVKSGERLDLKVSLER